MFKQVKGQLNFLLEGEEVEKPEFKIKPSLKAVLYDSISIKKKAQPQRRKPNLTSFRDFI